MKWRDLFEASALAESVGGSSGLVFGPPATDEEIDTVSRNLGVELSDDLRSLYREFNGVGIPFGSDGDVAWWIAPLDQVEENTNYVRDCLDDMEDEPFEDIVDRLVCFGDWMNGDYFGCVAEPGGKVVSSEVYGYNHEDGSIECWGQTLEECLRNA